MASIFSRIIAGEIPCYKIAENDRYFAFLDINPLHKGHTLVVPKREIDYVFDLQKDELEGLILFAQEIAIALKKAIECQRVGVAIIGLEVPHAHIHLIPIDKEGDMNFANEKLKLSPQEFQQISQSIINQLNN